MAVYRQIQITYWQDKFVLGLTPEEKFFYIYLLTNSKTKQCGIYEIPLQIIQVETGYNRDTVIKLLQKFIDYNKIKYDWEHEEIFLLNWVKHNPITNPNVQKCVKNELKGVHNPNLIPEDSPLQGLIEAPYKPLTSPLQGGLQEEKEEEKVKEESLGDNLFAKEITNIQRIVLTMKSWEDKQIAKVKSEYFTDLIPIDAKQDFIEAWVAWCDYRKEKKKKLVLSTAKLQMAKILRDSYPVDIITIAIERGWQSVVSSDELIKSGQFNPPKPKPKEPSVSPIMKMMLEANGIKTN